MRPTIAEPFSTEALRWDAVLMRDQQAEGAFLYAVTTTGVYCRPACASRLPKREHVRFFQTCSEAEEAGFRPCKRCQPNATSPHEAQVKLVTHLCNLIETSETSLSLSELAIVAGLSPYYLQRLFKAIVGVTPKAYAIAQRQQCLRDDLQKGRSVTQAIYDAGFSSSSQVYGGATSMLGMAPSQYKAGATDVAIRFAIERSSLGLVLIAATDRGICAINFGDTPEILTEQLQARFPKAQLQASDPAFSHWVAQVLALIETPDRGLDLPLDIQGTAFQQRVWQALQAIPPGTTMSYTEVAKQIEHPTAVRAVAAACAANTLAVVIPCHRVVRSNGALSGYRWGIERKRALLEREALE
ncbi:bifunctional DNA-binding transcriptional regulator/O6-methylguanine-DNA methyltransferase Ada [Phormidium sp. FACHB-592]|uniref:Bifunctional DNA-binding transcriptional regulator/O6-methylguanine-DNA methyltransferase Ada n=1 Tax=Stenomitos frigidus AS-A4 TaxID=2933935 RepID=A0ABV0KNF8_9CYAN|nr:bifunctional DNA-binding transcriptional regulator/O6-methylguanine-DNA methyltransferase Ada [Phormidium sp. FACHB-592]MBD2073113.1 bifunctional DNA-binding transcriptional regulator/O6-methylguanine-DNA methyltransferase Ada [Phormidium sp. FACHB-592]